MDKAGGLAFHKTTEVKIIANRLAEIINQKLADNQKVIWLLSGGSAISIAVETASQLTKVNSSNLTIGLIDERYGPTHHNDSNWQQLEAAGFKIDDATYMPILTGTDLKTSIHQYNDFISQVAAQNSYKIGLLGIGSDGHTAGILPNSPAVDSSQYVDGYQATDYQRITLTGKGLQVLDRALVYAAGTAKTAALKGLATPLPPTEQPAQLLKQIARVDVYNDVIGDSV